MTDARAASLGDQLARARARLRRRLRGLTDRECFWEPVANCWTVRPRETATSKMANGRGDWVIDYELPDPTPPPFTTIAWRLVHVAVVADTYRDWVFRGLAIDYDAFDIPHTARGILTWWNRSVVGFIGELGRAARRVMDGPVAAPWGEIRSRLSWSEAVVEEVVHHGAEALVLRDLYRAISAGQVVRAP